MNIGCQAVVAGVPKQPAMDEAINAIHDEVLRYKGNLNGLINRLEAPRPACEGNVEKSIMPTTIGEALHDIYSTLVNCNDILQATNRRIDEQIGELKLLP